MIYLNVYKIICPLIYINQIDVENFSKDLNNHKIKAFNKNHVNENF